jgi:hypothetical protein
VHEVQFPKPFEHAHAHNGTAAQDEALARIVETLAARSLNGNGGAAR